MTMKNRSLYTTWTWVMKIVLGLDMGANIAYIKITEYDGVYLYKATVKQHLKLNS